MCHQPRKQNKKKPQHAPKEKKTIKQAEEARERHRCLYQALRSGPTAPRRGSASKGAQACARCGLTLMPH